jgi:hypothetical protein
MGTPYVKHSATSKIAAKRMEKKVDAQRERVFQHIDTSDALGATDQEMQDALGLSSQSEGPRRVELWKADRIRDSERTRKTRAGNPAVVWVHRRFGGKKWEEKKYPSVMLRNYRLRVVFNSKTTDERIDGWLKWLRKHLPADKQPIFVRESVKLTVERKAPVVKRELADPTA